jgi:hypothetical protein
MKRLFVCCAVMFALSSCGGGWSSAQKDEFVKTCTSAATGGMGEAKAKDYCNCMLPKVEKKYPNPNDAGKMSNEDMTKMAEECLK